MGWASLLAQAGLLLASCPKCLRRSERERWDGQAQVKRWGAHPKKDTQGCPVEVRGSSALLGAGGGEVVSVGDSEKGQNLLTAT